MQVPYRKPGKYSQIKPDPMLTQAKLAEIEKKLAGLKRARPEAAREVARLAELGDFSENVEYQLAKGRLRGINNGIERLERQINHAEIIRPQKNNDAIQLGHTVTIESGDTVKTFRILGSAETDPKKGIISQNSPIGAALMGRKVGDLVKIHVAGNDIEYSIRKIE